MPKAEQAISATIKNPRYGPIKRLIRAIAEARKKMYSFSKKLFKGYKNFLDRILSIILACISIPGVTGLKGVALRSVSPAADADTRTILSLNVPFSSGGFIPAMTRSFEA